MDSFNSEDGFGSPYKRICELHALQHCYKNACCGPHPPTHPLAPAHAAVGTLRSVLRYEASGLEPGQALIAIVMEYCDRGSLAGAIKAGAFTRSPDNPLAYVSQLCREACCQTFSDIQSVADQPA